MITNEKPDCTTLESFKSSIWNELPGEDNLSIKWSCNLIGEYDPELRPSVTETAALVMGEEAILYDNNLYLEDKVWIESEEQCNDTFDLICQYLEAKGNPVVDIDLTKLDADIDPEIVVSRITVDGLTVFFGLDDWGYMICMMDKRDFTIFDTLLQDYLNEDLAA